MATIARCPDSCAIFAAIESGGIAHLPAETVSCHAARAGEKLQILLLAQPTYTLKIRR